MDKNIERLIELAKENPTLEIVHMVDYEVCASDECTYWMCHILSVKKGVYWYSDDRVYIGEEEIKDEMACQEIGYPDETDDDAELERITDSEYNKRLASGEIVEAIIIYLGN
jgi:hypothetical protein